MTKTKKDVKMKKEKELRKPMRYVFRKKEMQEMEEIISSFMKNNNLTIEDSKNPVVFAKKLGFSLFTAEFDKSIDGAILVDENSKKVGNFDNNKIIAVNSGVGYIKKRFIIAHELSHYIMGNSQNKSIFAFRDKLSDIRDESEQKIDYMAAALLMPKDEFCTDLKNLEGRFYEHLSSNEKDLKLMEKYQVDLEAITRRKQEINEMTGD